MRRRQLLGLMAVLGSEAWSRLALSATLESDLLAQHDLNLEGDRRLARRALVLTPRNVPPGTRLPVLVLLHGLGETGNERLGIRAWSERYGLISAYERLCRPPVRRVLKGARYLTEAHAAEINEALAMRAFQPLVLVCPVTPNPGRHASASAALDAYARWITENLLGAVSRAVPATDMTRVGLDGCSLGGYVALEVFLRQPERFATLGTVQAAFGVHRAAPYARSLEHALGQRGAVPIHLETSSEDPYRKASVALASELERRGLRAELVVLPGPHNQPWLQEIGTLEMLRWHSAKLAHVTRAPSLVPGTGAPRD